MKQISLFLLCSLLFFCACSDENEVVVPNEGNGEMSEVCYIDSVLMQKYSTYPAFSHYLFYDDSILYLPKEGGVWYTKHPDPGTVPLLLYCAAYRNEEGYIVEVPYVRCDTPESLNYFVDLEWLKVECRLFMTPDGRSFSTDDCYVKYEVGPNTLGRPRIFAIKYSLSGCPGWQVYVQDYDEQDVPQPVIIKEAKRPETPYRDWEMYDWYMPDSLNFFYTLCQPIIEMPAEGGEVEVFSYNKTQNQALMGKKISAPIPTHFWQRDADGERVSYGRTTKTEGNIETQEITTDWFASRSVAEKEGKNYKNRHTTFTLQPNRTGRERIGCVCYQGFMVIPTLHQLIIQAP